MRPGSERPGRRSRYGDLPGSTTRIPGRAWWRAQNNLQLQVNWVLSQGGWADTEAPGTERHLRRDGLMLLVQSP